MSLTLKAPAPPAAHMSASSRHLSPRHVKGAGLNIALAELLLTQLRKRGKRVAAEMEGTALRKRCTCLLKWSCTFKAVCTGAEAVRGQSDG